jgi:hypothetical protein
VLACRTLRTLHTPLSRLKLLLQCHVALLERLVRRTGALKLPADLMKLDTLRLNLMPQRCALLDRPLDLRLRVLQRIGHANESVDDANCTLNVNDGVVPAIVHTTRWNVSMFVGSALVTVAVVFCDGYVSLVVHVVPSGES